MRELQMCPLRTASATATLTTNAAVTVTVAATRYEYAISATHYLVTAIASATALSLPLPLPPSIDSISIPMPIFPLLPPLSPPHTDIFKPSVGQEFGSGSGSGPHFDRLQNSVAGGWPPSGRRNVSLGTQKSPSSSSEANLGSRLSSPENRISFLG